MKDPGYRLPDVIDPDRIGVCVPVPNDDNHRRAFLGALHTLTWSKNWERDSSHSAAEVARVWQEVYDAVSDALGTEICSGGEPAPCVSYSSKAGFISYGPNDPRYTPDYVPTGYASPPWYEHTTASGLAYGTFPGDIVTTFERLPFVLPGFESPELWPWIKVSFHVGPDGGEVEFHLRNVVLGSLFIVTRSDQPLYVSAVDVNKDLPAAIPETEANVIVEMTFESEGDHWVQFNILPNIDVEEIPITYGGGLHHVVLCGDITPEAEDEELPLELNIVADDLVLLYDGIPIDTIPKASLQSWLDRWVDTTGDDMTGVLNHKSVTSSHETYYGSDGTTRLLRISRQSAQIDLVRDVGKVLTIGGAGNVPLLTYLDQYVRYLSRPGLATPLVGNFRFGGEDVNAAAHFDNAGTGDVVRFSKAGILQAVITGSGIVRQYGAEIRGLTSTASWQKQAGMQGGWVDSVHATRKGLLEIDVSGYDGDHEVLSAEYGADITTLPKIGFFGHTRNTRQELRPGSTDGLLYAIRDQLAAYGLLDAEIAYGVPSADPGAIPEPRKCSAAYYFADSLAAMISDVFTNLETVSTDEVLTGLIEDYKIPANAAHQVLLAFQAAYADETGIVADLTDPEDIAEVLIGCDFDRDCFYDWIDVTSGWIVQTAEIIKAVLDVAWETLGAFWFAYGQFVDHPSCNLFQWPCSDLEVSFLFGPPAGVEIQQGIAGGLAAGLTVEESGPNWGSWVNFHFDECAIDHVEIDVNVVYVPQWLHVMTWTGDPGDYTLVGQHPSGNLPTGIQTVTLSPNGAPSNCTRLSVRFENEPTASAANVIYAIRIYME